MSDDEELEHERLPEEWVETIDSAFDEILGSEDRGPYQPLDRYLFEAFSALRRVAGAIQMRIGSNLPLDDQLLKTTTRRDRVLEGAHLMHEARQAFAEVIGIQRIGELERERSEEIRRRIQAEADEDEEDGDPQ